MNQATESELDCIKAELARAGRALQRERLVHAETNRRMEEKIAELKAAQACLVEQERLRALGQMASGIAHDFNNSLSPILGFIEVLLKTPALLGDAGRCMRYLQIMKASALDAANVVRRLREFYRAKDKGESFRMVGLAGLIANAIDLSAPKWKAQALMNGVSIVVEKDVPALPDILCNEHELREALLNLIFNAVDALGGGGRIVLRARLADDLPAEGRCEPAAAVLIEVEDNGAGMPEPVRRSCLEPFFTTKGDQGTGLGLPMVYGIVQRHRGKIRIASEPGKGTCVSIVLPVAGPIDASGERTPHQAPLTRPLHVLVVDDEPAIREVLVELLKEAGHSVDTAANGRQGLEKFLAGRFDLVVSDQGMPLMSGDQLISSIRSITPLKPIILLTGFGAPIPASAGVQPGADLVLGKPFTGDEVRDAIAALFTAEPSTAAAGSAAA